MNGPVLKEPLPVPGMNNVTTAGGRRVLTPIAHLHSAYHPICKVGYLSTRPLKLYLGHGWKASNRRAMSALEIKVLTLSFPHTQLELRIEHAAHSRETSAIVSSADACLLPNCI